MSLFDLSTFGRPLDVIGLGGLTAVGVVASFIFYTTNQLLVFYPLATTTLATGLYTATRFGSIRTTELDLRSHQLHLLRTIGFLGITGLVVIDQTSGVTRPDRYFLLFLLGIGLILGVAFVRTDKLVLLQLLLLALATRIAIFQAAPVIGVDTTLHQGIVGYMKATGELIPTEISYYHWYPIAHTAASILGTVANISARKSLFIATSLAAVGTLPLIFLVTRCLYTSSKGDKAGMLAVAIVIIGWPHLNRTAIPIAQTMSLALLPAIMYLLIRRGDRRFDLLLVCFLVVAGSVHVLIPIVLSGLMLLLVGYVQLARGMSDRASFPTVSQSDSITYSNRSLLLAVLLVYMFEYLMFSQNFSMQIRRMIVVFKPGSSLSDAVTQASNSMLQTRILLELDPLLLFAGSLLVLALFVILSIFFHVERLVHGEETVERSMWTFAGAILFGAIAVVYFVGQGSHISRVFPTITLIVSPIAAVAAMELRYKLGAGGTIVLLVILITAAYLGIASPTGAVPERTDGFQPMLTESEMAVISFVNEKQIRSQAHPYIAGRVKHQQLLKGRVEWYTEVYYDKYPPPEDLFIKYASEYPDTPFIHRGFYSNRNDLEPPPSYCTVYDSGNATIVNPC